MLLPDTMIAMILMSANSPLVRCRVAIPVPLENQVLVKVIACGVCRTDLHIVDGELMHPKPDLIPGHEIVGRVVSAGNKVTKYKAGDFVGIPWLGYTCGQCRYCKRNRENLCENARFTGYTIDGGYAQFTVAYEQYCFPLDSRYANPGGTPLLCAGLIGFRSYRMIGREAEKIGIYGFGAAAHILIQVARFDGKQIYAFTRKGDRSAQDFALKLGAVWAGDSSQSSPVLLDAAIIFAPAGDLIPRALADTDKGAVIVCGGIHMSDIPSFPYKLLWEERVLRSVANLTQKDGEQFLELAPQVPVETQVALFPLIEANEALDQLRNGKIQGAAVLVMN